MQRISLKTSSRIAQAPNYAPFQPHKMGVPLRRRLSMTDRGARPAVALRKSKIQTMLTIQANLHIWDHILIICITRMVSMSRSSFAFQPELKQSLPSPSWIFMRPKLRKLPHPSKKDAKAGMYRTKTLPVQVRVFCRKTFLSGPRPRVVLVDRSYAVAQYQP